MHLVIHHRYDDPHRDQAPQWALDLSRRLGLVIRNQERIMATIAELQAAVARNTDAEDSVITLLKGISQQLKDAKASGDPAAIDAVISQLDANTARLGAAVVENTAST